MRAIILHDAAGHMPPPASATRLRLFHAAITPLLSLPRYFD